jgi:hypothetical protein
METITDSPVELFKCSVCFKVYTMPEQAHECETHHLRHFDESGFPED